MKQIKELLGIQLTFEEHAYVAPQLGVLNEHIASYKIPSAFWAHILKVCFVAALLAHRGRLNKFDNAGAFQESIQKTAWDEFYRVLNLLKNKSADDLINQPIDILSLKVQFGVLQ